MNKQNLLQDIDLAIDYLFFNLPDNVLKEIDDLVIADNELCELFTDLSVYCVESGISKEELKRAILESKMSIFLA